jgi:hypothetical protein
MPPRLVMRRGEKRASQEQEWNMNETAGLNGLHEAWIGNPFAQWRHQSN